MQHRHLVTQQRNARALRFDARFLQPSSKGQRFVGLLHLTASHSQPPEASKMKQLCVELEQAKHPAFYLLFKGTKLWVSPQKSKFSSTQCQSSTLWFQLFHARCSWNVQKNNAIKSESAKPWPSALWASETERLYWDKGCFKTPFYNCIFKPNWRLQVTLAFGLILVSHKCSSDGGLPKHAY